MAHTKESLIANTRDKNDPRFPIGIHFLEGDFLVLVHPIEQDETMFIFEFVIHDDAGELNGQEELKVRPKVGKKLIFYYSSCLGADGQGVHDVGQANVELLELGCQDPEAEGLERFSHERCKVRL